MQTLAVALVAIAAAAVASAQDEASAFPEPQDPFETGAATVDGGGGHESLPSDFLGPGGVGDLSEFLEAMELERSDTEELVDGIAAQVGNGVVLVSEVRRLAAPIEARMRKAGVSEAEILGMRTEALERLIESRLIDDVVTRAQLSATEAEVNNAVEAIAQENGLSIQQLTASIASHGLSNEEYRAKIKKEIERNKVLGSMIRSRVRVDDRDIDALYQQRYANQRTTGAEIHLGHLLIATGGDDTPDSESACQIVAAARERIVSGNTRFEDAAARLSDANRQNGGDLGWLHADELASWMAPAVAELEPGQVSEVVPMYFGCNLLMVIDRREVTPVTLQQARPELEEIVFRQKMDEEYVRWIDKIRETVYIERKGIYAETTRLGERSASR
jgi:peptidyl-prolyl cis-trans isomerase SurA